VAASVANAAAINGFFISSLPEWRFKTLDYTDLMLVVMEAGARPDQIEAVVRHIERMGLKAHAIPGANRTAIGITGKPGTADPEVLENYPGVKEVIRVSHAYKLVSREARPDDSIINVGGVDVGGNGIIVVGGPCAVESLDQARAIAEGIKNAGGQLFRGGAYKPRTSPYSFQGLGEEGLEILARVREEFDLPIVTEAIDNEALTLVDKYADCIQIGARNMQNFSLLKMAGRARKPVLLKRGMSATLEELLLSAEYIMAEGNYNVILCERGVRTFADHTRNTLDLSIIPAVKRISHLPILVDPSHGTGKRNKVAPMSRASIAAGADGVLIEVHHKPEEALSDGPQAILPEAFAQIVRECDAIAQVVGRSLQAALAAST
jgi:3-deoxy-7-phosphoheptulonate synthase